METRHGGRTCVIRETVLSWEKQVGVVPVASLGLHQTGKTGGYCRHTACSVFIGRFRSTPVRPV